MTSATVAKSPLEESSFEAEAAEVMRELRAGFLGLIEALPQPPRRAADLARVLGVNRVLAWQIHRVATAPNPLAASSDLPGRAAVKQVLTAARSKGASTQSIQRCADAMSAFEKLVKRHADDRSAFDMMIGSLAGSDSASIDVRTRRQLYRLQSQVWGVHLRTGIQTILYHPGSKSSLLHAAAIKGARDIRRLRPTVPFRMGGLWFRDTQLRTQELKMIGENSSEQRTPLLHDFCTQPFPELERREENEATQYYLHETPLGNSGARSFYLATFSEDVPWHSPEGEATTAIASNLNLTPMEVLVLDALFHRDMFDSIQAEVKVIGPVHTIGSPITPEAEAAETMPVEAEVHHLGPGLDVLPTPHVPRYAEMVETVCKRLGWDPEAFDVYRCIMEYPMLNSVVGMYFTLPERGNW